MGAMFISDVSFAFLIFFSQYERGNVSLASLTTEVATTKKGAAVQSRSASQSLVGFRRERNEIALASSAMETAQTEARSVQAVPASRPRVAMAAAGDLQRVKRKQKTSQALGMAKVPVVPPSVSQPTKFSISRTIPAEEDSEDGMCFGVKEFPTELKSPRTILIMQDSTMLGVLTLSSDLVAKNFGGCRCSTGL